MNGASNQATDSTITGELQTKNNMLGVCGGGDAGFEQHGNEELFV